MDDLINPRIHCASKIVGRKKVKSLILNPKSWKRYKNIPSVDSYKDISLSGSGRDVVPAKFNNVDWLRKYKSPSIDSYQQGSEKIINIKVLFMLTVKWMKKN